MSSEADRLVPRSTIDRAIGVAKAYRDSTEMLQRDEISGRTGLQPGSGTANTRVLAAQKYGLISSVRGSGYGITTLGMRLAGEDRDAGDLEAAIRHVPLFDKLFEELGHDVMRASEGPVRDIVATVVSEDRVVEAVTIFRKNMAQLRVMRGGRPDRVRPLKRAGSPVPTATGAQVVSSPPRTRRAPTNDAPGLRFAEHPLVAAVLAQAPGVGEPWDAERRDAWLAFLKSTIGYVYD